MYHTHIHTPTPYPYHPLPTEQPMVPQLLHDYPSHLNITPHHMTHTHIWRAHRWRAIRSDTGSHLRLCHKALITRQKAPIRGILGHGRERVAKHILISSNCTRNSYHRKITHCKHWSTHCWNLRNYRPSPVSLKPLTWANAPSRNFRRFKIPFALLSIYTFSLILY